MDPVGELTTGRHREIAFLARELDQQVQGVLGAVGDLVPSELISLFGSELRNLPDFEADFWLERRPLRVSFRLSALLRNRGRYLAAGVASVGFGPSYARVSTPDQDLDGQRHRLKGPLPRT